MITVRLGFRVALLLAAFAVAWQVHAYLPRRVRLAAEHWRKLEGTTARERERRQLEAPIPIADRGVPGLFRVADWLRPVTDGAAPYEVGFTVVARGGQEPPWTAVRAQCLLGYELAPTSRVLSLPYDYGMSLLARPEPAALAGVLVFVRGSEFLLFFDMSREEAEQLRQRVRERAGHDVLVPGRSLDARNHVYFLNPAMERLNANDPRMERYRRLLR